MPHPRYNTDQRPEDGSLPVFSAIWYIPYIPSLYSFTIFIYLTDACEKQFGAGFFGDILHKENNLSIFVRHHCT